MITPLDAWTLRTLLVGREVNGEMVLVSPRFRPIAEHLASLPVEQRQGCWDVFLLGVSEPDPIRLALADADPSSPPPGEEHPGGGGEHETDWPPLRLGGLPPAPPFPIDVLPPPLASLVEDVACAVGTDLGMAAAPFLPIAGGLIGRSTSLLLGANQFASPSLLLANVGFPGDGKTPVLKYAYGPVRDIDQSLAKEFAAARDSYKEAVKASKGKGATPPPPVPRRVVLEEATMESIGRRLSENPRGLVMIYDELAVLLASFGMYKNGKGNDRANFIKMWSGSPVLIDRVLHEFGEPLRIPHPQVAVFGNLPPTSLALLGQRADDGMIDRWLFVFPERRPKLKSRDRRPVSNEALAGWDEIARRLWDLRMDTPEDAPPCPRVVFFTNEGWAEFLRGDDAHVDEMNSAEFPDSLRGPWSKLQEYAGRLCLVLTMLRHASDPTAEADAIPRAGAAEARDAWRLVAYFKAHHKRVRAYLQGKGLGGAPDGARLVLNWIRQHPDRTEFSGRDLSRAYPPSRDYDRATMEDGLAWLRDRHVLRPAPQPDRPKGTKGRTPTPVWEVHPDLPMAQQKQPPQQNGGHFAEIADSAAHGEGENTGGDF